MKNKTKKVCKILSVFLALLIAIQILPLQVLAENIVNLFQNKETTDTAVNESNDVSILYEVEEKRDEHTKVYKKNDGSYTVIKTIESLHYLNDGVWEEIDNTMSLDENLYKNTDNQFNVELPKSIDSNKNLTVEKDGYELSFTVDDIDDNSAAVVENNIAVSDTNIPVVDETIAQTQSSVTYNNVAEDTNLQYIVTPNSIKENIIVSNKESVKDTYTFTFETNGLNSEKLNDGSVVFTDELNEIKFRIPRPVMTDAGLAFSYDINVNLIENTNGTITLEYSPSSEWTNSTDRVYPITIDPAITVEKYVPWVEDTYVAREKTNGIITSFNDINYSNANIANLATNLDSTDMDGNTTTFDSEVYTKLNMDFFKGIGDNVVFTEVQYLFAGNLKTGGNFLLKEIEEEWDVNSVTYANKPRISNETIDYYTSPLTEQDSSLNGVFVHFNITNIFSDWFNGKTNNGFAVIADKDAEASLYLNSTYSNTAMVLDYVEIGGYNENLSYHTQSVGRAGTGYINDFSQHLSVIRDDITIADDSFPISIGMIYDSASYNKLESLKYTNMMAYGNKWVPNYLRAFISNNENSITYYTETGYTIDFFRTTDNEGNVTYTELHSNIFGNHGYKLEYHSEVDENKACYTVNRPDGYIEHFDINGLLVSVTNPINPDKSISIVYDDLYRIDHIIDGNGYSYDYNYCNSTNLLLTIIRCCANCAHQNQISNEHIHGVNSCPHMPSEDSYENISTAPIQRTTCELHPEVNFTYDNNKNLKSVIYPDNKYITYEYDADGNMISIRNIDGYQVVYEYEEIIKDNNGEETLVVTNKVKKATEQTKIGETYENGNFITYEKLNTYQTKLTDATGDYEIYHFGVYGNLLYTIDSNGKYVMHEDVDSTEETHYASVSDYRSFSENLLSNSSFEETASNNTLKSWETAITPHGQSSVTSAVSTTVQPALFGSKVLMIHSNNNESISVKQLVNINSGGIYTLSAYILATNESTQDENTQQLTLSLHINTDSEEETQTSNEETPNVKTVSITTTNGKWERYTLTLENIPDDTECLTVELKNANGGTFYIDGMQLEQSSSASLYNYIENGGFNSNLDNWTTTSELSVEESNINGKKVNVINLPGGVDTETTISQTITIDGKTTDVIRVGAWFKGNYIQSSTNNIWLKNIIETVEDPRICNFTDDRCSYIEVTCKKTGSSDTQIFKIPFQENLDDWQFVASEFTLNNNYDQATITIHYSKNMNTASFSNIELTKTKIRTTKLNSQDKQQCPCVNCTVINCSCNCNSETYCFCSQCILENENPSRDTFGNIMLGNNYDEIITVQMLTQRIGNNVTENYKLSNALLESTYDTTNSKASYTYNKSGSLAQVSADGNIVNLTYDNDRITTINQNGTTYKLKYDSWGQLTQVSVGDIPIVTYQYDSGEFRNRIIQVSYHNNTALYTTQFDYDDEKNTITISTNDNKQFTCTYDSNSKFINIIENNGRKTYNINDRTEIVNAEGNKIYTSDTNAKGNIVETICNIKYTTELLGVSKATDYEDGSNVTTNGKNVYTVAKTDALGRYVSSTVLTQDLTETGLSNINSAIMEYYEYNDESNLIATHNSYIYDDNIIVNKEMIPNYITNYEYDSKGNVIKETVKDNLQKKDISCTNYVYNNLNQLIRVNKKVYNNSPPVFNTQISYTYTYEYNNSGNIRCKKIYDYTMDADLSTHTTIKTIDYQYDSNDVWKDKLVSYGDTSITYDNIGNPTIIKNTDTNVTQRFTWKGYELYEYYDSNKLIKYEYDVNGQCYRKAVLENGNEIESYDYIWSDGKLISQIYCNGTTTYVMKFIYDILNTPYGFILSYYNEQENVNPEIHENVYLYIKNMKGDIIGVVNESRNIVLTYEYDVWGVTTTNINAGVNDILKNIADVLPMRYRGYFFDNDTGLYYIQGRYYNPEMCRFINADRISDIGYNGTALNYNLYTYCKNNPMMYVIDNKDTSFSNTINSNYFYNKRIAKGLTGYIDDQKNGIASKLRYGLSTIGPLGCGWVATYNALIMLGNRLEPCDIIKSFEMNNLPFNGLFGTNNYNIARFFVEKDYDVTITNLEDYDLTNTKDLETVHKLVKQKNTVHILLYKNPGVGHFIALKYNGEDIQNKDVYITYNENTKGNGVANSINEFIPSDSYAHTLISISTK